MTGRRKSQQDICQRVDDDGAEQGSTEMVGEISKTQVAQLNRDILGKKRSWLKSSLRTKRLTSRGWLCYAMQKGNECTLYGPWNKCFWTRLKVHASKFSGLICSQPDVFENLQTGNNTLVFLALTLGDIQPLNLEALFSYQLLTLLKAALKWSGTFKIL